MSKKISRLEGLVARYQLHRVVRELEVFDDRFMGEVHTSTGTVKSEPPAGGA